MTLNTKINEIDEIKISVNKYSIYLEKLVKDLKKRNHPLDKIYSEKPELRWFPYKSWYHPSLGESKIIKSVDWSKFVYAVYHDLKKDKYVTNMEQRIKKITKDDKKVLFDSWLLEILFVFFTEGKDKFFSRKKLVNYLIQSIKKKPIVKTKSLLSGIVIQGSEVVIDKKLKIRKAKKEDLEFMVKMGNNSYDYSNVVESSFCILEHTYTKERDFEQSFEALNKVELILELFKLSYVHCTGTIEKSSEITFTSRGTTQRGFYSKNGIHYYAKIKRDEIKYLKKFYKIMNKKITRSMLFHFQEDDEIKISLSRFTKGLEWIHHISSVSYAVMAIEALLLKSEGEQKLRFALKTSKLLSLIGLNMEQVYGDMRIAYDVRSKYMHGDKMSKGTEKEIKRKYKKDETWAFEKFAFTMMDYARLIIAIYFILDKSKDELYKLLEDAQFDNEIKLKKELKVVFNYLKMDKYKPKFKIYESHKIEYLTE